MTEELDYLVDDVDITVGLLDEPLGWRVRGVDEILIDAATSARHRRSLQCAPLRDFLPPSRATTAFVAIPVCSIARGPLLDFDVEGPLGNAWLLPRLDIADREAKFLELLASRAGEPPGAVLVSLVSALVGFADGSLFDAAGNRRPVVEYISDGIGGPVPAQTAVQLGRLCGVSRTLLLPHSDKPATPTAPEIPALGIPRLIASGACGDLAGAVDAVHAYVQWIKRLSLKAQRDDHPDAVNFLEVLADYGHNFELTVATKVPVDEPFTVKFEERLDLRLGRWRNQGSLELVTADAMSNHVALRVDDPNVRIASCEPRSIKSPATTADGAFVVRRDEQTRSFYCYDAYRDFRVRLDFRLALLRRLMFVPYLLAVMLLVLAVALIAADVRGVRDIALVTAPATFAAGVLGVRESSSLGSRLRLLNSAAVACGLGLLLAAAACQLLRP